MEVTAYAIEWIEDEEQECGDENIEEDNRNNDNNDNSNIVNVSYNINNRNNFGNGNIANYETNADFEIDDNDLIEEVHSQSAEEYYVEENEVTPNITAIQTVPNNLDQIAAENLIYLAQDCNVTVAEEVTENHVVTHIDYSEPQYFECQVTEEVITDGWVQEQGKDRVEIPVENLGDFQSLDDDIEVPLPTIQDSYSSTRPYPCDFCSRRFRKRANLMNHIIAHKNDRPHICNLCGSKYMRRLDLLNHLKVHAQVPESDIEQESSPITKVKRKASRQKKVKTLNNTQQQKQQHDHQKLLHQQSYPQEDIQVIMEASQHHENYSISANDAINDSYIFSDDKRPFVCQTCGVSFAREKALLSHSRLHGGDSPFECDSCSEMFWDISLLREHQRMHHTDPHAASNSDEYEPDNNDRDSDSDEDSKYGDFFCNICGLQFHRNNLLKRHTKTHIKLDVYDNDLSLKHCCNVCGETFNEALDLLAHAEIHARIQPFKCMLCGESFLEEITIKKHLSNVHVNEMTETTCRLCGKQCKDSRSLIKHAWDHSREKNHSCSKCGKTFHNKARLKRHMLSHRNKSVQCDVCGDDFPDGRSLMNHRHSHTNVTGRQFPCKECSKTFGSRSSQQIHMRIHTGERPYGCRYCWKAFADGGTLRKHERIHTGEKPYACPICPRAFNQRVVLREHIRSHHSGPDTKHGTAMTPYYCAVCNENFALSLQLIQHLIEHSDMNTAMKRQPSTGPRKYKRRRKLKPHELEQYRAFQAKSNSLSDDEDFHNEKSSEHILSRYSSNNNNDNNNNDDNNIDDDDDDDDDIGIYNKPIIDDTAIRRTKGQHVQKREKKISFSGLVNDNNYSSVYRSYDNNISSIEPIGTTTQLLQSPTPPIHQANSPNESLSFGSSTLNLQLSPKYQSQPSSSNVKQSTIKKRIKQENALVQQQQQQPINQQQQQQQLSQYKQNSRPKMIHTQKMRVAVEDGKRKTRTLITRTDSNADNNSKSKQNNKIHRKRGRRPGSKQKAPTKTSKKNLELASAYLYNSNNNNKNNKNNNNNNNSNNNDYDNIINIDNKPSSSNTINIIKDEIFQSPTNETKNYFTQLTQSKNAKCTKNIMNDLETILFNQNQNATENNDINNENEYIITDSIEIEQKFTPPMLSNELEIGGRRTSKRISNMKTVHRYDKYRKYDFGNKKSVKKTSTITKETKNDAITITPTTRDERDAISNNTTNYESMNYQNKNNGDYVSDSDKQQNDDNKNEYNNDGRGDNINDDINNVNINAEIDDDNNNAENDDDNNDNAENDDDNNNNAENDDNNMNNNNNNKNKDNVIRVKKEKLELNNSEEIFRCEMCAAEFEDRAKLLIHVPIHI